MARHRPTPTKPGSFGNTTPGHRSSTDLWRDAFGPGYAVGPGGRLVDYVARASGTTSDDA